MTIEVLTDIEAIVGGWLRKNKIAFEFSTSLKGGWYELGGIVVDFLLPERFIAIRVMGEYWHKGVVPEGKDQMQREALEAMDLTVVDVWASDLEFRLEETMQKAILGKEMLK